MRPWLSAAMLVSLAAVGCTPSRNDADDAATEQTPPPNGAGAVAAPAPASVEGGVIGGEARSAMAADAPATLRLPHPSDTARLTPSLIIRSGTASLEVDSLEPAIAELRRLALRLGGYVGGTSVLAGREQVRAATLEVKVPAPRFDELTAGLRPLGRVEAVSVSAEDVGEEYVDVEGRLAAARRLEDRLLDLLATRTGRLQDVLAVERELARVRGEIERYEGRLRYLRAHAALSTLRVTLHEPPPLVGERPGASVLGEALRQAWRNFVTLLAGLIAGLGFAVPLAGLGWAALLLVRHRYRRA